MKIMFLLLILMLKINLYASQKITIQELIALASSSTSLPIVLSENIDKESYIYHDKELTDTNINDILSSLLFVNGYVISPKKGFLFISKKSPDEDKILEQIIKIQYLTKDEIDNVMNIFDIKKYLFINDFLYFHSSKDDFLNINKFIRKLDTPSTQKKIKITIAETNLNKLHSLGSEIGFTDISKNLFNFQFGSISSVVSPSQVQQFNIDFKYLIDNGITKIITSPVLTIRDLKDTKFDITRTIPVKKSTQTLSDTLSSSVESIEYQSFGIKLNLFSRMLANSTDIDFDMVLQDIVSTTDNMPTTSDKKINQSVLLKDGSIYFLSGFKKVLNNSIDKGIPVLKDIPGLGYFFSWQSDEDVEIALYILIEVFENDNDKTLRMDLDADKNI